MLLLARWLQAPEALAKALAGRDRVRLQPSGAEDRKHQSSDRTGFAAGTLAAREGLRGRVE
jgi:hypothetical protein